MVTISQQISTQRSDLERVRSNTLKAQQEKNLKQREFENFRRVNLPRRGSGFVRRSAQFRNFKLAEKLSNRANNALRSAEQRLRGLKATQDKQQQRLTTAQRKRIKKIKKGVVSFAPTIGVRKKKVIVKRKRKLFIRKRALTPREKRIEAETKVTTRPVKRVAKGTIRAPKQSILQKVREKLTPFKDRKKETGFVRGLKGAGAFVVDIPVVLGKGVVVLVKSAAEDVGIIKSTISRSRIKNVIDNFSLAAIGAGLGKLVQSQDPFLRTQGLLSVIPFVAPIKVISTLKIIDTIKPTFKTKINAKTGNSVTIIKRQGELSNGDKVKIVTELKSSGKTGDVKVKNKVTRNGKTKTDTTLLKNEGGFFKDTKTGKIIEKGQVTPDRITYKITQVTTDIKPKRNIISGDTITIVGRGTASSKTVRGVIAAGKKSEVTITRVSKLDAAVNKALRPIDVVAFKQFFTVTATRKRIRASKKISEADLTRFLQAVRFEKEIVLGLDRRGRVARALGLRRESPIVKNISKLTNEQIKILTGKGVIRAEGVIEGFVIKKVKTKRNALFESKKASTLFFNGNKLTIPKGKSIPKSELNTVFNIPKKITVPKLRSHIKNLRRLKVKGIIPAGRFKNYLTQANDFIDKQKQPTKIPVKLPARLKAAVRIPARARKTKGVSKTKAKLKPTPRPSRKIRLPRLKAPGIVIPLLLRIRLKGLRRKGSRAGFIIRIKEGKTVIEESKDLLPRKRAINVMRKRLDNTPQASGATIKRGKTSIVDVKKTILNNKFRIKRSKSKLVQIQVEKRKFRLDTKGEQRGLRRAPLKRKKKSKRLKRLKRRK